MPSVPRRLRCLAALAPTVLTLLAVAACSDQLSPTGLEPSSRAHRDVSSASLPKVSAGNNHVCAVRVAGTVICWGDNSSGQLNVPPGLTGVTKISAGATHTCAVRSDASLVCWGDNRSGQTNVPAGLGPVANVSAGWATTCALLASGTVNCWGWDYNSIASGPNSFGHPASAVSVNYTSTCVVGAEDNQIHCWGANDDGGVTPPAGQFHSVSMAAWGGCALAVDGTVPCWGYGAGSWFTPPAGQFLQVSSGSYNACVLSTSNDATCFGMTGAGSASNVAQISAGGGFDCAVKFDATISCFGGGTYTLSVYAVPVEFGGPIPPVVSAGGPYTGLPNTTITMQGVVSDPAHNAGSISWSVDGLTDGDGFPITFGGLTPSIPFAGPGTYTAHLNVNTSFGLYQSNATVTITDNAPPVLTPIAGGAVSAAGLFTAHGTFTDPSSSSWTAMADYGDGTGAQPVTVTGGAYTMSHQYEATGTFAITLTLTDNQGLATLAATSATITNAPASIAPLPSPSIIVGDSYTADGTFTDPGSRSWTATVNYGDGSATSKLTLQGNARFTLKHTYNTAGTFTVAVQIKDNQGAIGVEQATVIVQGAAAASSALATEVTLLAASGKVTTAAATSINAALNAAAAAIAAGDKNTASLKLAGAVLTIANELRLGRMSTATATQLGESIGLIVKAIWFP